MTHMKRAKHAFGEPSPRTTENFDLQWQQSVQFFFLISFKPTSIEYVFYSSMRSNHYIFLYWHIRLQVPEIFLCITFGQNHSGIWY